MKIKFCILLLILFNITLMANSKNIINLKNIKTKSVIKNGNEYILDYLIIALKDKYNTSKNAISIASKISGNLIGSATDMKWWQIKVNVKSLSELKRLKNRLKKDIRVDNVLIDMIVKEESDKIQHRRY